MKDECIARYLFDELANENQCAASERSVCESKVFDASTPPRIGVDSVKSILVGDQYVSKFNEGSNAKNLIKVYLGVIRWVSFSFIDAEVIPLDIVFA